MTDAGVDLAPHHIAIAVIEGLVRNHFGKRGRGRPKQNSEYLRVKNGLRQMLRAAQISITAEQELVLMTRLMNKSLFDGDCS
jgi:hypothetical protein